MTITIIHQAPSPSEVKIRHTQPNVTLHVTPASSRVQNPGTLYIADECLYFFSTTSNTGISIPYPSIIIHAIARESAFGPSLYCQLEGSLAVSSEPASSTPNTSNGAANGDQGEDQEEDDEDQVLEMTFVPAEVSALDTMYENLSYCASLHDDGGDDGDYMDEDDYYQDDENDHEGLYADADIQGGYIPKHIISHPSSAIGHSNDETSTTIEPVPAIDLQSGEWYTGNAESDAKFQLSEQGQVTIMRMEQVQKELAEKEASGKRIRDDNQQQQEEEEEDQNEAMEGTEEEQQEARSKIMENLVQDPHGLLTTTDDDQVRHRVPTPAEEEPGEDAEEDRFKSVD
ncbi:hypothetical protein BG004_007775 [Podila humilis]|nr:hypothetical protein BG004_007775 [Podila humilis]